MEWICWKYNGLYRIVYSKMVMCLCVLFKKQFIRKQDISFLLVSSWQITQSSNVSWSSVASVSWDELDVVKDLYLFNKLMFHSVLKVSIVCLKSVTNIKVSIIL